MPRLNAAKTRPKGRPFQKGNPGGPGRPPRKVEEGYLQVACSSCGQRDWADIIRRAVKDALAGSDKAREFLRRILVGDRTALEVQQDAASLPDHELRAQAIAALLADPVARKELEQAINAGHPRTRRANPAKE